MRFSLPLGFSSSATSVSAYSLAVLADAPVAYWKLDEASGTTAADSSGNGLNGTYIGGFTLNQASPKGGGVTFDGSSGVVQVAHNSLLNLSAQFSIEFWFKPVNLSQSQDYLLSKGDNRWAVIWEYVNDKVELYSSGPDFRSGSQISLADSNWHHLVYTYNGTTLKGFLDGSNVFSVSKSLNFSTDSHSFHIGGTRDTSTNVYSNMTNGSFAHVALYNKSIESQIATHYGAG